MHAALDPHSYTACAILPGWCLFVGLLCLICGLLIGMGKSFPESVVLGATQWRDLAKAFMAHLCRLVGSVGALAARTWWGPVTPPNGALGACLRQFQGAGGTLGPWCLAPTSKGHSGVLQQRTAWSHLWGFLVVSGGR